MDETSLLMGSIETANYRERRTLAEETITGTKQPRYGRCLEKGRGE
jgi:hypothetical protein